MFQAGNEFGAEFDELQYVMKQVMIIKVYAEDPKLMFDPSFRECRDIILRCFSEIIASGEGLQRVSRADRQVTEYSYVYIYGMMYDNIVKIQ